MHRLQHHWLYAFHGLFEGMGMISTFGYFHRVKTEQDECEVTAFPAVVGLLVLADHLKMDHGNGQHRRLVVLVYEVVYYDPKSALLR